jgi:TPP-dependent 2-oxoacid decarboxylase
MNLTQHILLMVTPGRRVVLVSVSDDLARKYGCVQTANMSVIFFIVLTTWGVGEFSASNGVAGSFAEKVKIIHVIGTTGKVARDNKVMVPHTLDSPPDHRVSVFP